MAFYSLLLHLTLQAYKIIQNLAFFLLEDESSNAQNKYARSSGTTPLIIFWLPKVNINKIYYRLLFLLGSSW